MDIVSNIIKLFFGSKTDKDRKQIEPYVQKIKDIYPSIERLSNDELREHSAALMKQIADFIASDEAHIAEQKVRLLPRRRRSLRILSRLQSVLMIRLSRSWMRSCLRHLPS